MCLIYSLWMRNKEPNNNSLQKDIVKIYFKYNQEDKLFSPVHRIQPQIFSNKIQPYFLSNGRLPHFDLSNGRCPQYKLNNIKGNIGLN